MLMRLWVPLLVVLQGCGSPDRSAPDLGPDSPWRRWAGADVQSAAIEAVVASNHPAVVLIIGTRVLWSGDSLGPTRSSPAWRDFVQQAHRPGHVPGMTGDSTAHRVNGAWRLVGEVTDTSLIALSGVGFSPAGDEAVVFMDYRCGARCGMAAVGTFRRRGEGWVLSKADTTSRH